MTPAEDLGDGVPRSLSLVLRGGGVVLLAFTVVLLLVWLSQRRLVFPADRSPVPSAASVVAGGEDVSLTTDDGLSLGAWFVPPADRCGAVVLVAGGNGGNRASRASLLRALAERGLGVLLIDYRGYGGNPGSPTEAGLILDAGAAHRYLVDRGYPAERTVYFGESLGGAVMTELAARHPPAALVLRSPFTDLAAVAAQHYPFLPGRMLLRDRFPLLATIASVRVPVTVVLGTSDSIVDPGQSRQVAGAAPNGSLVEVAGADHNDAVLLSGAEVIGAAVRAAGYASCQPT